MKGPGLRHNIVGNEIGRARPIAYIRDGRRRRGSLRRRPWGWLAAAGAVLLVAAAGLAIANWA